MTAAGTSGSAPCSCGCGLKRGTCWARRNKPKRKTPQPRERLTSYQRGYRMRRQGWTPEAQESAREAQGGLCAICGVPMGGTGAQRECRDHDHTTGLARALLCNACNCSLGHYESSQRGRLCIEPYESYLARHAQPS